MAHLTAAELTSLGALCKKLGRGCRAESSREPDAMNGASRA